MGITGAILEAASFRHLSCKDWEGEERLREKDICCSIRYQRNHPLSSPSFSPFFPAGKWGAVTGSHQHAVWVGSWCWAVKEAVLLVPSFFDFSTGHQKGQGTEWVLPGHLPVGQWIEESNRCISVQHLMLSTHSVLSARHWGNSGKKDEKSFCPQEAQGPSGRQTQITLQPFLARKLHRRAQKMIRVTLFSTVLGVEKMYSVLQIAGNSGPLH